MTWALGPGTGGVRQRQAPEEDPHFGLLWVCTTIGPTALRSPSSRPPCFRADFLKWLLSLGEQPGPDQAAQEPIWPVPPVHTRSPCDCSDRVSWLSSGFLSHSAAMGDSSDAGVLQPQGLCTGCPSAWNHLLRSRGSHRLAAPSQPAPRHRQHSQEQAFPLSAQNAPYPSSTPAFCFLPISLTPGSQFPGHRDLGPLGAPISRLALARVPSAFAG